MKKIFLSLLACLCLFGGLNLAHAAGYQKISAQQAKTIMDEGSPYILLDVRTPEEYKQGRIPGAVSIPLSELKQRAITELPDKDILIFTYCYRGGRSSQAAHELVDMGYTNVYDFGGISQWPYETEK